MIRRLSLLFYEAHDLSGARELFTVASLRPDPPRDARQLGVRSRLWLAMMFSANAANASCIGTWTDSS
ncbi:Uncharacterised protein [Mycobacteroides abscessus subsp. abscessus]|nr:Uncharacterised protein [Mycobacteroides abscessus subsp. abscessus]